MCRCGGSTLPFLPWLLHLPVILQYHYICHMAMPAFACHSMQDKDSLARIILENGVNHVVHLATLLSGAPLLVVEVSHY